MTNPTLQGTLGRFGPVHVLRMLREARATGRLHLVHGDESANIWIEDGRSLFARASTSRLRVGDILVRRGELVKEAVEFALALQTDNPGERIGRMLVGSGALSEVQLREGLLAVQRHVLGLILRWQEGAFSFVPDERVEDEDVRLDFDSEIEAAIIERWTTSADFDRATDSEDAEAA